MSVISESPRGSCVLGGVNNVLSALNRVCPIYHSGPGCGMQNTAGEAGQAGGKTPHFLAGVSLPSSWMLEREVVFGGIDKLRGAIDGSLEIIDADAYFVLNGCTSGIIGDDSEALVKEYQARGLPVYNIKTPGFAGDSLLGYEAAFQSFLDEIVEYPARREKDLVNILGIVPYHDPYWFGTLEELARILRRLGLRVHTFFTEDQGIAEIKKSSSAALNIIVNPWLLKSAAKQYEEKFGVPHIRLDGLPIGATDTTRFVRQVAKALSLDETVTEKTIHDEEAYVYHLLETIIGALSWKKFAVVADASIAVGMTRFLANDYSFTPVLAIVTDPVFRGSDKERVEAALKNLEHTKKPEVFFIQDHYEIMNKLREYDDITLLAGSSLEREAAAEKGIQILVSSFPVSDLLILNKTYAGYRGSLTLVEDLFTDL
jgi:nitrogenase molybdenum-iron protein beta chain